MHNEFIAIIAAAVAAWIFGAIWYGLLGKAWQAAQGLAPGKGKKMPVTPMVASFLCELLMAFVFSQLLISMGAIDWQSGAITGLLLAIGFMVTIIIVNNLFQGRQWMLIFIDSGHWIGVAVIQGAVLTAML
ncbi:MAG TPA: DUF1761 domain-containing protein [Rhizomicrobium sp.]